jgi:histidyl-tRNA synthetase
MLKRLRGTKDILPADVGAWRRIESSARDIFDIYGYKEVRTPVIEEASLFIRSIGDATDIVQKEMYMFSDRGGRTVALRPEATASIVRAYLENSLGHNQDLVKLFYIGPMFRSERPQKGRQRQFHQLGVEAIGSDNYFLDVEVISLAVKFLKELEIKGFDLKINTLGCEDDKSRTIERYKERLKPYLGSLCDECRARYTKNVLRVLDCKSARCRDIVKKVNFEQSLCGSCTGHFESVQGVLKELGIDFAVEPTLVRGLDYYTRTIFEIIQEDLGSKDAICAGGRYDNLIKEMGGEYTPAVGFAFGIERLMISLKKNIETTLDVFVARTDEGLIKKSSMVMNSVRDEGLSCDMPYQKKSLKAQMKKAEKLGARYVIFVGELELKQNRVRLRDMTTGEEDVVSLNDATKKIKERK